MYDNWLDKSHRYVSNSTGAFANWVDHFFGTPRDDIESAWSQLRITTEWDREEHESMDSDTRVRAKVRLPRVNNRLSLLFTDEDDEEIDEDGLPEIIDEDEEDASGELQYRAREKKRYRLDIKVGVRSSGRFKSSVRYRYELPYGDKVVNRFTETVYFVDGDGFSSRLELDHDRSLSDRTLVRWSNRVEVAEEFDGLKWSSRLSYVDRLGLSSALTQFAWASGETRPKRLTTSYGIGSRYRRSVYRPWLLMELGPTYIWKRVNNSREGRWQFALKLEVLLENLP